MQSPGRGNYLQFNIAFTPRQLKLVFDLAIVEECKAELT